MQTKLHRWAVIAAAAWVLWRAGCGDD